MYNDDQIEEVVNELIQRELTTMDYYFEIYEEETEKREALHGEIIKSILNRKKYSTSKRVFMLGGAPANGKSTFTKSGVVTYPEDALNIDPDEIKSMLPEYRFMTAGKILTAAEIVHEESSFISKEIRKIAIERGYDLILDGVANDTIEKRETDIQELKSSGPYIRIDYVTLDTNLSLQLAELRFESTGRRVPDFFVKEKNKMIAELVPQLLEKNLFDELYLWDTNIETEPRLILCQKNGKLEIENEELYRIFKLKANEN
jgi:predicted ABC-type ATPase